ncbi:unknown [Prevotella sp. CAG:487]|nr:unknown [Prevotella sp. CAG:487]
MTALLKFFSLIHEQIRSKHHSVADDVHFASLKYTGRNATQNIFLSFKLQSVTCVWSALKTGNDIIFRSKHIHNLSLAFVSPLKTKQYINFTCIHLSEI